MTFTQVRETTFMELQPNAGVALKEFDPAAFTGELDPTKILFATSGGLQFNDTPEYRDAGESVDNAPKNTMELKKFVRREIKVSGTMITFTPEVVKMAMAAADTSTVSVTGSSGGKVTKITPRDDLKAEDFTDFWMVGDRIDGGYFAVHLKNALSTGGFSWKTNDQDNGTSDFELTAHYSIKKQNEVPYEAYVMEAAAE